jgi:riboflavin synthase
MFTGLVQEVGRLAKAWRTGAGRRFVVSSTPGFAAGIRPGDSLMVNGCCQTVEEIRGGSLTFTAVPETLAKTTLGSVAPGSRLNLERALTADQGLGGHMVTGHVDAIGVIVKVSRLRGAVEIEIAPPAEYMRYVASKGSIAVDGMSLTVVSAGTESFTIALIPHTLKCSIADAYRRGTRVNLEVDIVARYVERLAQGPPR